MAEINIKRIRQTAELSQQALADLAGVAQTEVSKIERGERRPKIRTMKRIAAVLGFDWQKFYEGDE